MRTYRSLIVAALACALRADAQSPRRLQAEARIEAIAGRTTAWRIGAGANIITAANIRVALLAAAGVRRINGTSTATGGVDVVARFHFDPFQQFPRGFYAGGGAALLVDDGARRRVRALIVAGFEGTPSPRGRWITGAEIGLGGGVRVGVTLRRARVGAR